METAVELHETASESYICCIVQSSLLADETSLPYHPAKHALLTSLLQSYLGIPPDGSQRTASAASLRYESAVVVVEPDVNSEDGSYTICPSDGRALKIFHDHEYVDYVLQRDALERGRLLCQHRRKILRGDRKRRRSVSSGCSDDAIHEDESPLDDGGDVCRSEMEREQSLSSAPMGSTALPTELPYGGDCSSPNTQLPASHRFLTVAREDKQYGLQGDAAPFVGLSRCVLATAAGSLTAAASLIQKPSCSASIHWFGGRHHAMRGSAGGFCYVNDIVLAVMHLLDEDEDRFHPPLVHGAAATDSQLSVGSDVQLMRTHWGRVLVVDIDVHHGDGTQQAFYYDERVYTVSFHQYGPGMYTRSGGPSERGGRGAEGSCTNIPLGPGTGDDEFIRLFEGAMNAVLDRIQTRRGGQPQYVVLVCGADTLEGDPLGRMNVSIAAYVTAVRWLLQRCAASKFLFLGAGGYVDTSTARLLALITELVLRWCQVRPGLLQQVDKVEGTQQRSAAEDKLAAYCATLVSNSPSVPDDDLFFDRYRQYGYSMTVLPPKRQRTRDKWSEITVESVWRGALGGVDDEDSSVESTDKSSDDNDLEASTDSDRGGSADRVVAAVLDDI